MAQGIDHEPAFAWWAPHVLKKRDRIIMKDKSHYHKQTHKFGIEIPKQYNRPERLIRKTVILLRDEEQSRLCLASPITTTSAHDTSNRGGDVGEDVEGVVATPTEDVEVSIPERHNDFKGEKRVCRDTSTTYKHTSPLINTSKQHMK